MPKISIIVPIYNVEKYLRKCVDSILNQTFKEFELILVDDGSPDACGEICDSYANKDARVKVIHKKNGGLSDARNAGLDIAKGSYIGFVDSDDYIDKDMYEILYQNAINQNADVSMCRNYDCDGDKIASHALRQYKKILLGHEDIIVEMFGGKFSNISVCTKLFRNSIIGKLKFPYGKTSEDAFIIMSWIMKSEKIIFDSRCLYYYVNRVGSITHSCYSEKIYDVIEAYQNNLNTIVEYYPKAKAAGEYRLWWAYRIVIERIMYCQDWNSHIDSIDAIQKLLRKKMIQILKNKYLNWKQRGAYILICFNYRLYMWIKNKDKNS